MRMKWRINFLALLGAIIGVISIFLPWGGGGSLCGGDFYYDLIAVGSFNPALTILFVLGTGLSFITSLGGVIQFITLLGGGVITFFDIIADYGIRPSDYGTICALISSALIMLSIFLLITIPPLEKPYSLRMRLLTFARIDEPNLPVQTKDEPNVENAP